MAAYYDPLDQMFDLQNVHQAVMDADLHHATGTLVNHPSHLQQGGVFNDANGLDPGNWFAEPVTRGYGGGGNPGPAPGPKKPHAPNPHKKKHPKKGGNGGNNNGGGRGGGDGFGGGGGGGGRLAGPGSIGGFQLPNIPGAPVPA